MAYPYELPTETKYGAVLIDPPWPFDGYTRKGIVPARGKQPYETMKLYEIAGMPVPDLLAPAAAVFLWKNDSLPRMPAILAELWGLRLVTDNIFIWRKTGKRMGMGFWSRKEGETLALMTKGRPKRLSGGVRQFIDAPRREHSRKPDEIYNKIEALVAGPYLELFGRATREGWDAWGDETGKFDQ